MNLVEDTFVVTNWALMNLMVEVDFSLYSFVFKPHFLSFTYLFEKINKRKNKGLLTSFPLEPASYINSIRSIL